MKYKIILASKSPRRREIMKDVLGLDFESQASDIEDIFSADFKEMRSTLTPLEYVERVSEMKCADVHERMVKLTEEVESSDKNMIITISADTVVECEGRIFEKPTSEADARAMMMTFSNSSHRVHTGVCVQWSGVHEDGLEKEKFTETTVVNFAGIDAKELDAYIARNEWKDKAGGYGIQGAAAAFIKGIEGDYFNVVGFPVHKFSLKLNQILIKLT